MANIGFIGTGIMGLPMVQNLQKVDFGNQHIQKGMNLKILL